MDDHIRKKLSLPSRNKQINLKSLNSNGSKNQCFYGNGQEEKRP